MKVGLASGIVRLVDKDDVNVGKLGSEIFDQCCLPRAADQFVLDSAVLLGECLDVRFLVYGFPVFTIRLRMIGGYLKIIENSRANDRRFSFLSFASMYKVVAKLVYTSDSI